MNWYCLENCFYFSSFLLLNFFYVILISFLVTSPLFFLLFFALVLNGLFWLRKNSFCNSFLVAHLVDVEHQMLFFRCFRSCAMSKSIAKIFSLWVWRRRSLTIKARSESNWTWKCEVLSASRFPRFNWKTISSFHLFCLFYWNNHIVFIAIHLFDLHQLNFVSGITYGVRWTPISLIII